MIRDFEQIVSGTNVRVVWSDDIDPRDTAPLWASVQFITGDAPMTHPSRRSGTEQVLIEVASAPPEQQLPDQTIRRGA